MIYESLKTEVKREYDVAVCGGGIAGISAALASARQGKKTVLFERQYMLGGLATAGLITIYLPLCNGVGNQVSFGIAEELLKLSIKYGAEASEPENWLYNNGPRTKNDGRYQVRYNAQLFAMLAEELLTQNGVDIMYGTYIVRADMKDDKIEHLIAESKSGRVAYKIKSVVDTTGDCDIAKFADAPTDTFKQGNILAAWYYGIFDNKYDLCMLGVADIPDSDKTDDYEIELLNKNRFLGLDAEEVSKTIIFSHKATLKHFLENKSDTGKDWPVTIPTVPQVRMTRKLVGEYVLSDREEATYFEDSIGIVSNWKKRGPSYEVPFRTLYSSRVKNLITAGRCTSVTEEMWDIMRVIPCCAVTGEAAGIAAAMSDDFTALDIKELQNKLKENGVVIHKEDIGL